MVEQASRLLKPARGRFYLGVSGQTLANSCLTEKVWPFMVEQASRLLKLARGRFYREVSGQTLTLFLDV